MAEKLNVVARPVQINDQVNAEQKVSRFMRELGGASEGFKALTTSLINTAEVENQRTLQEEQFKKRIFNEALQQKAEEEQAARDAEAARIKAIKDAEALREKMAKKAKEDADAAHDEADRAFLQAQTLGQSTDGLIDSSKMDLVSGDPLAVASAKGTLNRAVSVLAGDYEKELARSLVGVTDLRKRDRILSKSKESFMAFAEQRGLPLGQLGGALSTETLERIGKLSNANIDQEIDNLKEIVSNDLDKYRVMEASSTSSRFHADILSNDPQSFVSLLSNAENIYPQDMVKRDQLVVRSVGDFLTRYQDNLSDEQLKELEKSFTPNTLSTGVTESIKDKFTSMRTSKNKGSSIDSQRTIQNKDVIGRLSSNANASAQDVAEFAPLALDGGFTMEDLLSNPKLVANYSDNNKAVFNDLRKLYTAKQGDEAIRSTTTKAVTQNVASGKPRDSKLTDKDYNNAIEDGIKTPVVTEDGQQRVPTNDEVNSRIISMASSSQMDSVQLSKSITSRVAINLGNSKDAKDSIQRAIIFKATSKYKTGNTKFYSSKFNESYKELAAIESFAAINPDYMFYDVVTTVDENGTENFETVIDPDKFDNFYKAYTNPVKRERALESKMDLESNWKEAKKGLGEPESFTYNFWGLTTKKSEIDVAGFSDVEYIPIENVVNLDDALEATKKNVAISHNVNMNSSPNTIMLQQANAISNMYYDPQTQHLFPETFGHGSRRMDTLMDGNRYLKANGIISVKDIFGVVDKTKTDEENSEKQRDILRETNFRFVPMAGNTSKFKMVTVDTDGLGNKILNDVMTTKGSMITLDKKAYLQYHNDEMNYVDPDKKPIGAINYQIEDNKIVYKTNIDQRIDDASKNRKPTKNLIGQEVNYSLDR